MGRFKVRNIIRKQNGITLIEVLAAFVLISILTIILINVQIGSQKQYNQQFETNSEINEVSYAL
ncbi:prepilin-type N-terminal cleavage/methylation domain-containing protein [Rummeliibacillus stabekisii]|uniref:prepilin-type N-terminal cleavage/methylation domain-containing protein n=1 Tax=Rummeliibacillus stabekisii TaxID=241244 RepID=UPI000A03F2DE